MKEYKLKIHFDYDIELEDILGEHFRITREDGYLILENYDLRTRIRDAVDDAKKFIIENHEKLVVKIYHNYDEEFDWDDVLVALLKKALNCLLKANLVLKLLLDKVFSSKCL